MKISIDKVLHTTNITIENNNINDEDWDIKIEDVEHEGKLIIEIIADYNGERRVFKGFLKQEKQ